METIYEVTLSEDAYSFDGDTLTFTIPVSLLPAEAARRMAPGTSWTGLYAVAMDQGPSMWAFYGDTEGNNGRLAVRTDFALGGGDYVVGEDASP